jgi:GMP synthase (glutamine-hydrolysing)
MTTAATDELIAILDYGSQYRQLIARRVRENRVYSRLFRGTVRAADLRSPALKGIILSGGPASVYEPGAPQCDPTLFDLGVPVLGICYGMQLGCQALGARVKPSAAREFGRRSLRVLDHADLFRSLPDEVTVWMSHGDQVDATAGGFETLAETDTCPHAAIRYAVGPGAPEGGRPRTVFYGVQFHPEVTHTAYGSEMLQNFLYHVCRCTGAWQTHAFIARAIDDIRRQVGDGRVICGLSGGVDSSVLAALLKEAIGDRLTCILVNNGLLREGEVEGVVDTFQHHFAIDLRVAEAADLFLSRLAGVTEPQEKRRIIGHTFIEVFQREAEAIPDARFLAQGTLYPDVIESGALTDGPTATIKGHHNVWGLPKGMTFELVEPLRDLFKDEVRQIGAELGLPDAVVWRHPFPGPGLAVRVIGAVTPERLATLRRADRILLEEIAAAGLYRRIAQCFAVLLPVSSVGVMGDARTYENVLAIRAVETADFMTADWVRLPHDLLARVSTRIINEVRGINRVVYDVSTKPPSTIEWE